MDIPHLAVAATGSVDATDTNPPHPIHHRPSGYEIDRHKLKKFSKAFTREAESVSYNIQ